MFGGDTYRLIRDGCRSSAAAAAPVIDGIVKPRTVIDVGCGEGWWASAFAAAGCEATGIERQTPATVAPGVRIVEFDLTRIADGGRPKLPGRFDLAVCLEVAEHLPERAARPLVGWLTELAAAVVFSAAIPDQRGDGHLHERWPDYWAAVFAEHGYHVTGALRFLFWTDGRVAPWYAQNMLLAADDATRERLLRWFLHPLAQPFSIVHPAVFAVRAEEARFWLAYLQAGGSSERLRALADRIDEETAG